MSNWRLLSVLPMPDDVVLAALGDLTGRTELTLLPTSTVPELHAALRTLDGEPVIDVVNGLEPLIRRHG